jgi:glycosyltransferase involved in cell wall biosynthesis
LISVVAAWIAKRRDATLVNWLQDVFPEVAERLGIKAAGGLGGRLLRWFRNYSLRAASANVVLGNLMADAIAPYAPESTVRVIPNWSDGALIRPLSNADNPLRGEWGLDGLFVVGYSGNMGRAHEFQTILGACELLRANSTIAFLFTGAGPQRSWIEEESKRRSLGNLRFRPFQAREALGQSLTVPDVHLITLHPSLEGLIVPSKFYGIAAAGRPTIFVGDPRGEIGSLVEQHGCGIAIGTGDTQGLAAAIERLAQNPGVVTNMGELARKLFESEFDRTNAFGRWIDVFSSIAPNFRNKHG